MDIFFLVIIGIIGGIIGGMGMGGGTLLIPMLVIFLSVEQQTASSINLISFIPMAIVCLIFHIKNHFVAFKVVLFVVLPALVFSVAGAVLAQQIDSTLLTKIFGGFLIALSFVVFYMQTKTNEKEEQTNLEDYLKRHNKKK